MAVKEEEFSVTTPAREYPPPNVECLNGAHDKCDGIATRLTWDKGAEPAPECSCECHYERVFDIGLGAFIESVEKGN